MTRHTLYAEGDPNPRVVITGRLCDASHNGYACTLPEGRDHPQHVAGGSRTVCRVWPAREVESDLSHAELIDALAEDLCAALRVPISDAEVAARREAAAVLVSLGWAR